MNEYDFQDYSIFDEGISIVSTFKDVFDSSLTDFNDCEKNLTDDSIFMGPVSESCETAFTKIRKNLDILSENYQAISSFLQETSAAYKSGDQKAFKYISLDSNNKITTNTKRIAEAYLNKKNLSGYRLDFINLVKDGAVQSYDTYGVLPSLTMAQAILESGWGEHKIGNNMFGIKAGSNWNGKTINKKTGEQNPDGSRYSIRADFRDYDSIEDGIVDHAKLLTKDRYKPVIDSKNYKEACYQVKKCGYATSLDYSKNLINLIETYGLDQWDPK